MSRPPYGVLFLPFAKEIKGDEWTHYTVTKIQTVGGECLFSFWYPDVSHCGLEGKALTTLQRIDWNLILVVIRRSRVMTCLGPSSLSFW